MEYTVVGTFKRSRKDCEGETQDCKDYNEALIVNAEWIRSNKYKSVTIVRKEEAAAEPDKDNWLMERFKRVD